MTSAESLALFTSMNVMSEIEVRARQEVELETYILQTQIEGRVFNELVYNHIIPTALRYQNLLIQNIKGLKDIYDADYSKLAESQLSIVESIAEHMSEIKKKTDQMTEGRKTANKLEDVSKKAHSYSDVVKPFFEEIRYHCDKLEQLVDDKSWPLAKYRELLFIK